MEKRSYNWRIVSYASEEEIKRFCEKWGSKWEYILHNKDIKEDGSKKENHFHINITLKEWKSRNRVCELIESEENSFAIEMIDKEKAHRYLTHKDNPEKFQYEESEIRSNFKWIDKTEKRVQIEEFIEIAGSEKVSLREKAIILGRDFMKNYSAYMKYIEKMKWQELKKIDNYAARVLKLIKYKIINRAGSIEMILEDVLKDIKENREKVLNYLIPDEEEDPEFEKREKRTQKSERGRPKLTQLYIEDGEINRLIESGETQEQNEE